MFCRIVNISNGPIVALNVPGHASIFIEKEHIFKTQLEYTPYESLIRVHINNKVLSLEQVNQHKFTDFSRPNDVAPTSPPRPSLLDKMQEVPETRQSVREELPTKDNTEERENLMEELADLEMQLSGERDGRKTRAIRNKIGLIKESLRKL